MGGVGSERGWGLGTGTIIIIKEADSSMSAELSYVQLKTANEARAAVSAISQLVTHTL